LFEWMYVSEKPEYGTRDELVANLQLWRKAKAGTGLEEGLPAGRVGRQSAAMEEGRGGYLPGTGLEEGRRHYYR
jgi:hypothetical protein